MTLTHTHALTHTCLQTSHAHTPALKRVLAGRRDMMENGQADWAMGEAFAFGSLLEDGVHVRLSGKYMCW